MDDVTRLEIKKKLLAAGDQLEAMPRDQRVGTFNEMVARAFSLRGGARAVALDFNARLATEMRHRNVNL